MENSYLLISIALLTLMSIATRALPFVFEKALKKSPKMQILGNYLPPSIMLLLVAHCLEKTSFHQFPFGGCEIGALGLVVVLQLWRRNVCLSVFGGTSVYVLSQYWIA